MKSGVLSLTISLAFIASSYGLVCPQHACENLKCAEVTLENCSKKIVRHGGWCGCCDSCVTVLEPGANCFVLLLRGPSPPGIECPGGYVCDYHTTTCQPRDSIVL